MDHRIYQNRLLIFDYSIFLNEGITWENFYESPYIGQDSLSMNQVCLMLILDTFIYMTAAIYVEGVWPGEYGVPKKWFFPFQPRYWLGEKYFKNVFKEKKSTKSFIDRILQKWFGIISKIEIIKRGNMKHNESLVDGSIETPFEKELEVGIEIDLHKVYSRARNHALKGLTVKFYKNEISAFLGHNSAGKSTTLHLLTGLYTPTLGTARINGIYS